MAAKNASGFLNTLLLTFLTRPTGHIVEWCYLVYVAINVRCDVHERLGVVEHNRVDSLGCLICHI